MTRDAAANDAVAADTAAKAMRREVFGHARAMGHAARSGAKRVFWRDFENRFSIQYSGVSWSF